jgi:ABC-type dipeptide/oligopeptide/nickel transport system ATPase subunit
MHSHSVITNKAKRKLVVGEVEHMNLILQHPAYKADPFQTMQEHLLNTFARDRKQQELLAKQRDETDKHKAAEKLKLKKERLDGIKKKNRKKYKPRRTK